mgnify:CR=1 FL=1
MVYGFGIGVAVERAQKVDVLLRATPLPPFAQEIIFVISMGVVCGMLVFVTRELEQEVVVRREEQVALPEAPTNPSRARVELERRAVPASHRPAPISRALGC